MSEVGRLVTLEDARSDPYQRGNLFAVPEQYRMQPDWYSVAAHMLREDVRDRGYSSRPSFHTSHVIDLTAIKYTHKTRRDSYDMQEWFTPVDAVTRYLLSPEGSHQQRQTARYPTHHEQLQLPKELQGDKKTELQARRAVFSFLMSIYKTGDPRLHPDFEPVMHMAQSTGDSIEVFDNILQFDDRPSASTVYSYTVGVHSEALHDIGEARDPGTLILGPAVDDVASIIGKTADQRKVEETVLRRNLSLNFGEIYGSEMIEHMVALITHNLDYFNGDREFERTSALLAVGHLERARISGDAVLRLVQETHKAVPRWALKAAIGLVRQIDRSTQAKYESAVRPYVTAAEAKRFDPSKDMLARRGAGKGIKLWKEAEITSDNDEFGFAGLPSVPPKSYNEVYSAAA